MVRLCRCCSRRWLITASCMKTQGCVKIVGSLGEQDVRLSVGREGARGGEGAGGEETSIQHSEIFGVL